jgi:alpha-1,3-glucan synthase
MLEEERVTLSEPLAITKRKAKAEMQAFLGLNVDPEARMFVSLGRMVRQKGVDIIADIAYWILTTFENAQLIEIGPVADGYGVYAKERLLALSAKPEVQGRLFVKAEFMAVPAALKFASDFCLMPSRDEPFGYVDIEFAWHGALMVGAQAGGLGKVPGFYYIAQNKENLDRLQEELQEAISQAMAVDEGKLNEMAEEALKCTFPLGRWQKKTFSSLPGGLGQGPRRAQLRAAAAANAQRGGLLRPGGERTCCDVEAAGHLHAVQWLAFESEQCRRADGLALEKVEISTSERSG